MEENEFYKFVGVINFFGIYPDFLYPVFEKDNKYYLQKSKDLKISSFSEIKENLNSKIIYFIDEINIKCINTKRYYSIHDESVIAFQIDDDTFYASDVNNFIKFIQSIITDDHILIESIDAFYDSVNRRNKKIRELKI